MDPAIEKLRKGFRFMAFYSAILTIAVIALATLMILSRGSGREGVLRARGLVIVDDRGRDRILIGAPVPASADRVRTDMAKAESAWGKRYPRFDWYKGLDHGTNGLLILDEKGFDRVVVGDPTPDPSIGRRISPASGIQINDREGFERTGWGYFPDLGRVVLGLDSAKGTEAVVLVVREDDTAGVSIGSPQAQIFLGSQPAQKDDLEFASPWNGLIIREGKEIRHKAGFSGKPPLRRP